MHLQKQFFKLVKKQKKHNVQELDVLTPFSLKSTQIFNIKQVYIYLINNQNTIFQFKKNT